MIAAAVLVSCEPAASIANGREKAAVHLDFEDFPLGELSSSAALTQTLLLGRTTRPSEVVLDETGNKVLRVHYPEGQAGPAESGILFLVGLPPASEYYLSYRVRFDPNFDFRNGGKLPGLSSAGCRFSGGRIPTEGEGWSARLWWGPEGRPAVYLYYAGMKGPWGDVLYLQTSPLRKNDWITLIQRVRLNEYDEPNGVLQVWVDGSLALERHDVKYRSGNQGDVEALCFSTFHGGSDPETYGPRTTGTAFFDDILIDSEPPSATQHFLDSSGSAHQ
jgi:hypothetical protein